MAQSTNLKQQLPPPYEMRLIDIVRDRMKSQVGIDTVYNDEKKQILDTIDEQSKLLHSSCMYCCKINNIYKCMYTPKIIFINIKKCCI